MERNSSFEINGLKDITVHLAWGQLEVFGDEVERVQVMAAGNESTVNDLRIELKDGVLLIEQPQYGLTLNMMDSQWLQLCIRVPKAWKNAVHLSTISGLLSMRNICGSDVTLDTVSGDLQTANLTAATMALKTISGDVRGDGIATEKLNVRSVSGDLALNAMRVTQLKSTSVSGEQTFNLNAAFQRIDVTAVSGNVIITSPVETMNVNLRSVSGKVFTSGVTITREADAPTVSATGVSADLKLISIKE